MPLEARDLLLLALLAERQPLLPLPHPAPVERRLPAQEDVQADLRLGLGRRPLELPPVPRGQLPALLLRRPLEVPEPRAAADLPEVPLLERGLGLAVPRLHLVLGPQLLGLLPLVPAEVLDPQPPDDPGELPVVADRAAPLGPTLNSSLGGMRYR